MTTKTTTRKTSTKAPESKAPEPKENGAAEATPRSDRAPEPFTTTTGKAFINEFRAVEREGKDDLLFAKLGLITGQVGDGENRKPRTQYVEVLVGRGMRKTVDGFIDQGINPFEKLPVRVEIENLHIDGRVSDDGNKVWYDSKGVLTGISL